MITDAPPRVAFDSDVVVLGRLDGGAQGDEVTLERRRDGSRWERIATKPVNDNLKVRFLRSSFRRTSEVRLRYVDPMTEAVTRSGIRRIRVVPRLTVSLSSRHVMHGREVRIAGRLLPIAGARAVKIQQRVDGDWRLVDTARVRSGRYAKRFTARHLGFRRLRVVFSGDATNTSARKGITMRVYRRAAATWYGPGLYGNRTACGQRLTSDTVGVAHRTLPCGTKVAVLYKGRTIVVPVIDRGPYSHADWDLTERAARRLRFSGTDTIGVDPAS
ncbi:MAG: septal ring lytic transglycosylase RlpA family protein [Actinomycetota bacterium]|nr:septal ring lytic transglycosylase RlpA family protein [Actinomycetota bacterium]